MFTLAHLSDVHLGPLQWPGPRALLGKRLIGYVNWLRGRSTAHRRLSVEALTRDLKERDPDHIAITGDLVNLGLPAEFETALEWLQLLGGPEEISVVPGNHEAYVKILHEEGVGRWTAYLKPDAKGAAYCDPDAIFPYVRIRDRVALIGLSSAIPTLPFAAYGRVGAAQLERLPSILRALHEAALFRVVLVHHPPLPDLAVRRRALRDAEALAGILESEGAELVLYGHNHRQRISRIDTATGPMHAVCVPSASASGAGGKPLARYNLFQIEETQAGWSCVMTGRGLTAPDGPVAEIETVNLTG
jgi:3',5'-cyclic AMP phosphodiesterase CpdA